ncbi:hypothetical protein QNI16_21565 [Cytophagaceae bacterium YF14B1]|uniref:Uncharacterized protein n=1 Tax=Xanthocytophaga flava TaxID=3048013 RepID=A0AAE3QTS9_9BACT|nr:hypothetical protein [Xanthocytophaga flavus]MDJ1483101.1 hypothetical protein [Xanthocytophaga flavus]
MVTTTETTTIIVQLPKEEAAAFTQALRSLGNLCNFTPKPEEPKNEFKDDFGARLFLGGGRKPIAKTTFNKIRERFGLKHYSPTPGRKVYKESDLREILEKSAHD